jgi:DNA-binding NarL/FixJ family response regulator
MKILVVDDHPLIREALRGVLKELGDDVEILEASTAAECMWAMEQKGDIELVLLDLGLPDRSGFDILADLRGGYPSVGVMMMSATEDSNTVKKALDLGAQGFICKSAPRAVMLGAVKLVLAGGIYIPPQILDASSSDLPASGTTSATGAGGAAPPGLPSLSAASPAEIALTERQVDVLSLIMEGMQNKEICRELDLAEPTVKNHVTAILKALKGTNRTEAVIRVSALGWKLRKCSDRDCGWNRYHQKCHKQGCFGH